MALVLAGVAFACSSCGDRQDASGSASSPGTGTAAGVLPDPDRVIPDPAVQGSGERAQIQEVIDDVQDALLMLQGWGICSELTSAAQAAAAPNGDCVGHYDRLLRTSDMRRKRRVRSKVVSVDVRPRTYDAIAVLSSPGRDEFRVRLVGGGFDWKLPAVNLDDPTGLVAD